MMSASEPIVVTISHRLGRDEAKRRIDSGLGSIRTEVAPYVSRMDTSWDGYTLHFDVAAMLQKITGRLEVEDNAVRIEIALPMLLHMIAKTITGRIERSGAALLEGPKT